MEINTPYYNYALGGTVNPLYSAPTKYTESVGTPQPNNRNNKQPPQRVPKEDVMAFQQWAIANGYAPKGAKADGYFGPQTRQMVANSGFNELVHNGKWDGSTGMKLLQGAAISDNGDIALTQDGKLTQQNFDLLHNTISKDRSNPFVVAKQPAVQQVSVAAPAQQQEESLARMNDPLDGTIMSDAWQRTLGYRQ